MLLAVWALLTMPDAYGQNRPKAANVASEAAAPGSVASAFNKESQIPVNHYTGIPQVTIPIHNYEQGQLSHSLSVNYIGGGVRVNEPAGNTGLGWSLSGGGAITRSVQGLPDDMPFVGWLHTHNTRPYTETITYHYDPMVGMDIPVVNHIDHLPQYYEDQIDGQFDIFQLSVGGLSAKFYFGKNQQVIVSPRQSISITPAFSQSLGITAGTIESFTVVDESGVRYVFNERELTTLVNTTPSSNSNAHNNSGLYGKQHITAWYLRFIITPFSEDTIRFDYQSTVSTRSLPFPPTQYDVLGTNVSPTVHRPSGTSTIAGRRLAQVHFPNKTSLHLIYDGTQRCDASGEHALLEVQVRDTALRQRFMFNYTYASQRGTIAYGAGCNNVAGDLRLMLRSVRPAGPTVELPPYELDYEEGRRLPPLLSAAQDHWGFFNGQNQNQMLVPALSLSHGWFSGANRTPELLAASAYSLKAIKFPSGGVTSFDYESNTYMAVAELEQSAVIQSSNLQSQSFSFSKLNETATRFTVELTGSNELPEFYGNSEVCQIKLSIQGFFQNQWISGTTLQGGNEMLLSPHWAIMQPQVDLLFPPGTSQVRLVPTLQPGSSCMEPNAFTATVRWHTQAPETNPSAIITGGIRVRRITQYDGINARPASVREFRYVNQAGSTVSSGYIAALPKYHYILQFTSNGSRSNHLVRSGMPVNFQHYTQGSTVGYSRVEEIFGSQEQNLGRTVYEFTSYKDFSLPGHLFDFPYVPEQVPDWLLGLPKAVTVLDAAGRVTSKTDYEYTPYQRNWQATDSTLLAVKLGVSHEVQGVNGAVINRQFITRFYRPVVGWAALTRQVTTQYLEGDTLQDWVEMVYDTSHFVPIRTRSLINRQRNLIKETYSYYPFQYTIAGGAIAHMRQQNWLVPISTEIWLTEGSSRRLIESEINNYDWVGGRIRLVSKAGLVSSDAVAEATIGNFNPAVLNRNTTLQPTMSTVTQYDALGNPLETLNNLTGEYSAVIMGYDGRLPVAQIRNAMRSQVAYSSFETTETGGWSYSGSTAEQLPRSAMGRRAYNLATGSVTRSGGGTPAGNYVLSFWTRNGSPSVTGATLVASEANASTGWTYWEYTHTGGQNITISGSGLLDELRLYPGQTTMQTVNYVPILGDISTCGADNTIAWKEYDALGRPHRLLDKDWNIVRAMQYETATTQVVNRTPNWQDVAPLNLVCEFVSGTTFNSGNQLKQQTDINPFSFSFQGVRWVMHGPNAAACPIVAQWQPTGLTQCVVVNNVRTGEQLRQERDAHPLSPTFNQLRWVSMGVNGNCPPIQLKAWVQVRNHHFTYTSWGYQMTGDVYIVVTDQDGNPIQVPSLSVNYRKTTNDNGWTFDQNLSVSINNSSEALVYSGLLTDFADYGFGSPWILQYTFVTLPGIGYTPW